MCHNFTQVYPLLDQLLDLFWHSIWIYSINLSHTFFSHMSINKCCFCFEMPLLRLFINCPNVLAIKYWIRKLILVMTTLVISERYQILKTLFKLYSQKFWITIRCTGEAYIFVCKPYTSAKTYIYTLPWLHVG